MGIPSSTPEGILELGPLLRIEPRVRFLPGPLGNRPNDLIASDRYISRPNDEGALRED